MGPVDERVHRLVAVEEPELESAGASPNGHP